MWGRYGILAACRKAWGPRIMTESPPPQPSPQPSIPSSSPLVRPHELQELSQKQLKDVFIRFYSTHLFTTQRDDGGSGGATAVTLCKKEFAHKQAMVDLIRKMFVLRESDFPPDILKLILERRWGKSWNERINNCSYCTHFTRTHLRFLSPSVIRSMWRMHRFGITESVKVVGIRSKWFLFLDTFAQRVTWEEVVGKLLTVELVAMKRCTFEALAKLFNALKEARETYVFTGKLRGFFFDTDIHNTKNTTCHKKSIRKIDRSYPGNLF